MTAVQCHAMLPLPVPQINCKVACKCTHGNIAAAAADASVPKDAQHTNEPAM